MKFNDLSYKEYGVGKPIYFIHGLALDSKSMEYIYEPVFSNSNQYRRIYIDLPGMGKTNLEPDVKSTDDIFKLLNSFLKKDSNGEDIIICGHSFGGYLGLALTYSLSKQVDKIFLTCPVVKAVAEKRTTEKHKVIKTEEVIPIKNKNYFADYLAMNVLINKETWFDYQESIIHGLELFDGISWDKIQKNDYELNFEEELFREFPKIKGTVLLGEFDNVVGYKDQYNLLSSKIEDVIIVPNSGHNLPIDIKNEIAEELLKLLGT